MSNPKYNIHELLNKLPHEDYREAMNYLPQQLGISRRTLKAWMYRKMDDQNDIPSEALIKLADFFEVEPKAIYNFEFLKGPTKRTFKNKLLIKTEKNV